ncbi:MAG: phosphate ABC transporter substrate-binding protein [Anaerolineae bacterium]|nr:phosphate ABC transporter substrate-binding protein [Anaerolineae bacterium]
MARGKRRSWILWVGLPLCLLVAACGTKVETPAPVTVRIAGSTSLLPLVQDMAGAYAAQYPNVYFDVQGGGSQLGVEWLHDSYSLAGGRLDVAATSWWPPANVVSAAEGLTTTLVARDGIALVVHPKNTTPGLTLLQLQSIYAGHVLGWQEVGGPEGDIVVVSREDGSGTRLALESMVMGDESVTLAAVVMPSSAAVIEYVGEHPAAIGYVSSAYLTDTVRALPVEGQMPTPEAIRSGAYHLVRPLYLVSNATSSEAARAFLKFAVSPAGQAVVARRYAPRR